MLAYIDVCQSLDWEMKEEEMGSMPTQLATPETEAPCCVPSQGEESLLATEAEALALRFKALSDANRLRILSLASSPRVAAAFVCDLSGPLNPGHPTVSHHLKIMVEAALLNREKRGVWASYSLVPGALASLDATLTPKAEAVNDISPAP